MTIRDRGKLKWQPASFLPLAFEMQREMFKDQERQERPLLDQYQMEEFDQRICYAMESNQAVKLNVWADGFIMDVTVRIHYVDPITHRLRVEVKPGEFERIAFEDVVGVTVVD
ncbi:YolD-like protein [Bacillus sp. OV166]|uniref:YolD-like family protein n=1 Tax=Bacillus sp. OV166 TaxID=1882763 RepID=UPI000A2AE596|nr:YolD-like family protein [Bacillus sp. OV166]SMQ80669.1 YolD-like protein [Bacillus sp. OV166]